MSQHYLCVRHYNYVSDMYQNVLEIFFFQARSVGSKLWQPENGTREQWMRCRGIPCEQWQRAERKLAKLKTLALDDRKAADYPVRYLMFYLRYDRQI